MAGKNDFRSLKDFGTKELKFKQGVHMEAAYQGKLLSAPIYSKVNEGVCAALTMEWLKAKLSEGKYSGAFNPNPGIPASKNVMHQVQVWHAAQFQATYMDDEGTHYEGLKKLASNYGLVLRAQKEQPRDHFIGAFSKAAEYMAVGEGAYCGCGIKDERDDSKSSHAVGIVKLTDGLRFFDANVGAYKFDSDYRFAQFYERWGQLYRIKLRFHVSRARAYRVRNDPAVMPPVVHQ